MPSNKEETSGSNNEDTKKKEPTYDGEIEVELVGRVYSDAGVVVRNLPSNASSQLSVIPSSTKVNISKIKGDWCYVDKFKGWVLSSHLVLTTEEDKDGLPSKKEIKTVDKEQMEEQTKSVIETAQQKKLREITTTEQLEILGDSDLLFSNIKNIDSKIKKGLLVNNLNGIYGIPYQFMESVDTRLPDSIMGRKYAEKIISKMPLLCITPGKLEFMSNYSKDEQKGVLAKLISQDTDTDISDIIKENGRYFTFAFNYTQYFDYVNPLCRTGAKFLNIHDVELNIGGTKALAKEFDWGNALNKNLKATLTSQEFIGFYMDSTDSVSENFSNETTQSQLSSTVNGMSDLAREVGFLLGAGAGKQIQIMDESKLSDTMATIDSITDQYLGGHRLIKDIANNFATIAVGGKLLFPEIWADSQFSRSFDITIKLRTPDSDTLSWYLNIYVPLCHLIALAAGHQTDNANGYYSPFLIRAYYKGLFNVDMGIITDMSITKGKEAAWSIDGLPTEIDVSLTIKDLYNMLSIVPGSEPKNFVTNNILMDYIANTCGININQMDIQRSLEIYYILTKDKVLDLPNSTLRKFQDAIDTYGMNLYNTILNKFLI